MARAKHARDLRVPPQSSTNLHSVNMVHKSIAPKCSNTSAEAVTSSTSTKGCRRKIAFHPTLGYAIQPPLPAKVARRNARERNRVKQVNSGFEMLKAHIPSAARQKKMSKVDTLRHAVEYIQQMQLMLESKQYHGAQRGAELSESPLTPLTPTNGHFNVHQGGLTDLPHNQGPAEGPLTPLTPTNGGHFNQLLSNAAVQHGAQRCNESGYDTASSFYSSAASPNGLDGLSTPPFSKALPQYCNTASSPSAMTSSSVSYDYNYYYAQPPHPATAAPIEANDEEDELLDVIAKWQET